MKIKVWSSYKATGEGIYRGKSVTFHILPYIWYNDRLDSIGGGSTIINHKKQLLIGWFGLYISFTKIKQGIFNSMKL